MKLKFLILIVFTAAFLLSCNTTEPLLPGTNITLKTEDVSSIEAWIKITTNSIQLPAEVTLKKNNTVEKTISLLKQDSVIYIDSLLPKTTYTFQAFIHSNTQTYESNELSVSTMDTTSHNFTWQTWTFGEHSSSVLFDVAIIDENNIWAVGEIFMNDSLGNPDPNAYNAVHWDGQEWELKRINMQSSCNPVTYPPLKAIWAFSDSNIVVTSGGSIGWFNGTTNTPDCGIRPLLTGSINKIWGMSSPEGTGNDLYVVGNNGNIARWNGTRWIKLFNNGTDLNINDIWGDYNENNGEWEILAVGGNILQGGELERIILKIKGNQAEQINSNGTNWPLRTVWFLSPQKYYVVGSGVYEKHSINQSIWVNDIYDITRYSINKLRGELANSIVATGGVGELVYFNGFSWRSYIEETMLQAGNFIGIAIKSNLIIAVGQNNSQAVITVGKRIN